MIADFSIKYYEEVDKCVHYTSGIVYGETYADCAKEIAEYFGDENISSMNISSNEDSEGKIFINSDILQD